MQGKYIIRKRQGGFTYILILFMVALSGIVLAASGQLWSVESQREREIELRYAGHQIRKAIESYHQFRPPLPDAQANDPATGSTPTNYGEYPQRLEDLLEDRRSFPPMRHLRRLSLDPMTDKAWSLIREGDRITGVYSASEKKPLQRNGFARSEDGFANAEKYIEWKFVAQADGGDQGSVQTQPALPATDDAATMNAVSLSSNETQRSVSDAARLAGSKSSTLRR